jgi:hypothetical protein
MHAAVLFDSYLRIYTLHSFVPAVHASLLHLCACVVLPCKSAAVN